HDGARHALRPGRLIDARTAAGRIHGRWKRPGHGHAPRAGSPLRDGAARSRDDVVHRDLLVVRALLLRRAAIDFPDAPSSHEGWIDGRALIPREEAFVPVTRREFLSRSSLLVTGAAMARRTSAAQTAAQTPPTAFKDLR